MRRYPSRDRRRGRSILSMDLLEGRLLLASVSVANGDDSGPGSFRQAITNADADPAIGLDPIRFSGSASKGHKARQLRILTLSYDGARRQVTLKLDNPLAALGVPLHLVVEGQFSTTINQSLPHSDKPKGR